MYEQQNSYRICQQWQQLISEQLLGEKTHLRTFMLISESSKRGVAEKSTLKQVQV
jgi:hypothetical protein